MLFNSFHFLVFFPIVCLLYFLIPYKFRYLFLLIASYYFYMCWNPKYALLMFTSTAITYASGLLIEWVDRLEDKKKGEKRKKLFVALSFGSNLGILFFFKYFDFAIESVNKVLGTFHITLLNPSFDVVLPVGISFFTFQALSYTMDVYRKEIYAEKNFGKYALFVSFFPQLVAGPIERSKNLLKQISVKHPFRFENMRSGLLLMIFGYFQKVVVADNIATLVNQVYDNYTQYDGTVLAVATLLFAIQIYCDFGGYSSIAIGAARIMGFNLMENFNAPYLANSVADFWRRWHISLSTWFRDYLYIPLGGNRKGKLRKYMNLLVVFITSGLWHGASWHFVIWGGINGIYQVIGEIMQPVRDKAVEILHIDRKNFSHQLMKIIATFLLINLTWVFFRANSVTDACTIIRNIFTMQNPGTLFDGVLYNLGIERQKFNMVLVSIGILAVIDICKFKNIHLMGKLFKQEIWFRWFVYLCAVFYVLIFGAYGPAFDAGQFIYFQF